MKDQIKKLEDKKEVIKDEELKSDLDKKIEILKNNKTVTK